MRFFKKKPKVIGKEPALPGDPVLDDLPRGQERRKQSENFLPRNYFEDPKTLREVGFTQDAGDYFLGITGAISEELERSDGRIEHVASGGFAVGARDDRHITTIAGSRSGKGRSVIIPNLLMYPGSMIVIDPKGENATITCRHRAEKLGQNVCVLDPFEITAEHCVPYRKRFNPLRILGLDSPTLVEDSGLISAHWSFHLMQKTLTGTTVHVHSLRDYCFT